MASETRIRSWPRIGRLPRGSGVRELMTELDAAREKDARLREERAAATSRRTLEYVVHRILVRKPPPFKGGYRSATPWIRAGPTLVKININIDCSHEARAFFGLPNV